jgi:hypothetical protein
MQDFVVNLLPELDVRKSHYSQKVCRDQRPLVHAESALLLAEASEGFSAGSITLPSPSNARRRTSPPPSRNPRSVTLAGAPRRRSAGLLPLGSGLRKIQTPKSEGSGVGHTTRDRTIPHITTTCGEPSAYAPLRPSGSGVLEVPDSTVVAVFVQRGGCVGG